MLGTRTLALILTTLLIATIAGCGSGSSNNHPTLTSVPSPSPMPSPSPTPNATAQYEAALLRPGKTTSVAGGQIIVNASGASGVGQVMATNGAVNATYTITFQPYTNPNSNFQVGTVTSDASGNINATFTFAQKGTFAGLFHLSAGTNSFNTEIDPMDSGVDDNTGKIFNVPLVRVSTVTPAVATTAPIGTDPLSSGFVSAGNGRLHAELHGAVSNTSYRLAECGNADGSSCFHVGSFTTDASGNGTFDANFFTNADPRVVFEVAGPQALQYVSGFTVQ